MKERITSLWNRAWKWVRGALSSISGWFSSRYAQGRSILSSGLSKAASRFLDRFRDVFRSALGIYKKHRLLVRILLMLAGVVYLFYSYADASDTERALIIAMVGQGFLALSVWGNVLQTKAQIEIAERNHLQTEQSLKLSRNANHTERFFKSLEYLGHESDVVRMGAVQMLGDLALESTTLFEPCVKTIEKVVQKEAKGWVSYPLQIQAAIDVLIDKRIRSLCGLSKPLRFDDLNLEGFSFKNGYLVGAVFFSCNLTSAQFTHAILNKARFGSCDLVNTNFSYASLKGARFSGDNKSWHSARFQSVPSDFELPTVMRERDPKAPSLPYLVKDDVFLKGCSFLAPNLEGVRFKSVNLSTVVGISVDRFMKCAELSNVILPDRLTSDQVASIREVVPDIDDVPF